MSVKKLESCYQKFNEEQIKKAELLRIKLGFPLPSNILVLCFPNALTDIYHGVCFHFLKKAQELSGKANKIDYFYGYDLRDDEENRKFNYSNIFLLDIIESSVDQPRLSSNLNEKINKGITGIITTSLTRNHFDDSLYKALGFQIKRCKYVALGTETSIQKIGELNGIKK